MATPKAKPPTVFIVPGFWEGPSAMEPLAAELQSHGIPTYITHLKSTGTYPPNNPTLLDDIAHIRDDLVRVVDEAAENGVILFLHSAAGFIGSQAMQGLDITTMVDEKGKRAGVFRIIFCCAGAAPEGSVPMKGPFVEDLDDGTCVCKDAKNSFFNDFTSDEADEWNAKLKVQPQLQHWKATITHCGWRTTPSTYIVCEKDMLLPIPVQEKMVELVSPINVVRLQAGHMAPISATKDVAKVIKDISDDWCEREP